MKTKTLIFPKLDDITPRLDTMVLNYFVLRILWCYGHINALEYMNMQEQIQASGIWN